MQASKALARITSRVFDGLIAFDTENGDLIFNMLKRINKAKSDDPIAGRFVSEIGVRLMDNNTTIRRLSKLEGGKLPVMKDPLRAELEKMIAQHL